MRISTPGRQKVHGVGDMIFRRLDVIGQQYRRSKSVSCQVRFYFLTQPFADACGLRRPLACLCLFHSMRIFSLPDLFAIPHVSG